MSPLKPTKKSIHHYHHQILQKWQNKMVDFFVTCAKHHLGTNAGFDCLCFESCEWASLLLHCWVLQDDHVTPCSGLLSLGATPEGDGSSGRGVSCLAAPWLLAAQARFWFWSSLWNIIMFLSFVCPLGWEPRFLQWIWNGTAWACIPHECAVKYLLAAVTSLRPDAGVLVLCFS